MHGLINRSIQCFLRDTYGTETWLRVAREAELGFDSFEAMLSYDFALTEAVICAACHLLDRSRDAVLEDLGTYLVMQGHGQSLRRLLRFGGPTFADFLQSLEEMPDRARLALPELDLPDLDVVDHSATEFTLRCRSRLPGAGHVIVGLLRAMADDYGALSLVDHRGAVECGVDEDAAELVSVSLAAASFAEARPFGLTLRAV